MISRWRSVCFAALSFPNRLSFFSSRPEAKGSEAHAPPARDHGLMKLSHIAVVASAVAILSVAVWVRLNPSSLIMLSRDVKIRSPYCSVWKASLDGRIKLQQQAATNQIAQASRIIRREEGLALWSTQSGEYWVPDIKDDIILA